MVFKALIELLRPLNCFMAGVSVLIGALISGSVPSIEWFYAFTSVFLICGAGQAINDFFDLEIDEEKNPNRPIPRKAITPKNALIYSMILFFTGVVISGLINITALTIALVFSILLILYSGFLQKLKPLGNLIVASGTGFTLIFGASLTQNYSIVLILALSAFFANYARELTKDLEDLKTDKHVKKTLPMIIGENKTKTIIGASYGLGIGLTISVYTNKIITTTPYIILIIIASLIFILSQAKLIKNKFKESQKLSKKGMIIALIAFLTSVLKWEKKT